MSGEKRYILPRNDQDLNKAGRISPAGSHHFFVSLKTKKVS
jgi:hypothetical protein